MAKWPTIPAPGTTTDSIAGAVRGLKQIVEMMLGQRAGAPARVPVIYREFIKPGAANSSTPVTDLNDGDLFIDRSNADKLNYWDGSVGVWRPTT